MTTLKHSLHKLIPCAIFAVFTFNCAPVLANSDKVASLLKSIKINEVSPDKSETIAVSIIKQADFDTDHMSTVDLSQVSCGPLSQQNTFHLTNGNALFNPKNDIVVLTALAKISICAGSAVCVFKPEPGVISVYNLHSGSEKKVIVDVGGQPFILAAGMHITLCYEGISFDTINPMKQIAHRNLNAINLPKGICLYSAEFSIPSAIAHIPSLQKMLSSNDKDEQKLADQLVRSSVMLDYISNSDKAFAVAATHQPKQLSAAN